MKNIILLAFFLTSLFAQYEIEGRWHLVGYEDNVMYQFEDNYRYSIYSLDGTFGDIEDAGGSPNPYTVVEDIITIDLFFGTIVSYQMNYRCDGQVVDFIYIPDEIIHSTLFREGYNFINNECEEILEECADLSGISFPECGIEIGFGYVDGECQTMYCSPIDGYGVDWSNWIYNTIEECEEVCGTNNPITLGDINFDGEINILDVVLLVSFILGEPTDEYEYTAADVNGDSLLNVLDAILLIEMILNSQLPNECYIVPEVGPCDGICPTYYYNQNTNECEEFITGCCGVEAFNTLQECQNTCE